MKKTQKLLALLASVGIGLSSPMACHKNTKTDTKAAQPAPAAPAPVEPAPVAADVAKPADSTGTPATDATGTPASPDVAAKSDSAATPSTDGAAPTGTPGDGTVVTAGKEDSIKADLGDDTAPKKPTKKGKGKKSRAK